MSDPLEDADERITKVLSEVWNGGVVTGWVVIAVGFDEDGVQRRFYDVMQQQPQALTIGLLESFAALEKTTFVNYWLED